MGGILAQADIGDDHQFRKYFLYVTNSLLNDAVLVVGFRTALVFMCRNTEKQHSFDAGFPDSVKLLVQPVDGILVDARHGIDRVLYIFSLDDK